MSEQQTLLNDMADKLFKELAAESYTSDRACWEAQWPRIEAFGLPQLLLPEQVGGFNGGWESAMLVAQLAGRHVLALPVVESLLAHLALHHAEAAGRAPDGPLTIAHCDHANIESTHGQALFSGRLGNVPWGDTLPILFSGCVDGRPFLALTDAGAAEGRDTRNGPTTDSRSDLHFHYARLQGLYWLAEPFNLRQLGALLRCGQMAGALEHCLSMSLQYCSERQQFGRPLGKFQVIQHNLAQLAEHVAACGCAAQAAARAVDAEGHGGAAEFEIAAAKLGANRAVPGATAIAHQVHGAIGFTLEHALHRYTGRLLTWREDFGNDRYWARRAGQLALDMRSPGLWPTLTARGDRHIGAQARSCPTVVQGGASHGG